MLQKSTHCHQRTLSWTTGPSVTSPWLGLRWCWLDTSPPTSSPTIFRQVHCCAVQGQREASNEWLMVFTNLYLLYNNIYQSQGELTLTFNLQIKWTSVLCWAIHPRIDLSLHNNYCWRSVCDRVLDLISHPYGRHPGAYGPPGHPVPGAGQHLQQCYHQHSQGWGSDCHWGLDVGLYSFCVRGSSRVRNIIYANRQSPTA